MQMIQVFSNKKLVFGARAYRCALGRGGVIAVQDKREGDGKTPLGEFPVREIWYRKDRITLPNINFPMLEITRADGWCDAPDDPQYNQHVTLPYAASHETLWRDDDLYNVVVVIGHNDHPAAPNMGSCIFWHLASADYGPTAGCIAVSQTDMLDILPRLSADASMHIHL